MLSDDRVLELLDEFVLVKSDPRDPRSDPATRRFKVSRFVPEIVLLSPAGEPLNVLEGREVTAVTAELRAALRKVEG